MNVIAITDGACSGNPGPGGWAFALSFGEHTLERFGAIENTTNNAAELTAVLEAVRAIKKPCALAFITDSSLVIGLLSEGWKRKNTVLRSLCEEIEVEVIEKGVVFCSTGQRGTPTSVSTTASTRSPARRPGAAG